MGGSQSLMPGGQDSRGETKGKNAMGEQTLKSRQNPHPTPKKKTPQQGEGMGRKKGVLKSNKTPKA